MRILPKFALVFSVLLCASLVYAQSDTPTVKTINPTFTTIDVPGAGFTGVTGINTAGDMVGTYGVANDGFHGHGFILKNGVFSHFDYPNAAVTYSGGINDSDVVSGTLEFQGGSLHHGFIYDGVTYTQLDVPGQAETVLYGINNSGTVVGSAGSFGATARAYKCENGKFQRIDLPGKLLFEEAVGINNPGEIAGITFEGTDRYGYLYKNGKNKSINFPGTTAVTGVASINDNGIVVGSYFVFGDGYHGFAYYNGKYVSFAFPGAMETYSAGINNAGQIVGGYVLPDYSEHGFLTSPISDADFK